MNDREGYTPQLDDELQTESPIASGPANPFARPGMSRRASARAAMLAQTPARAGTGGGNHTTHAHLVPRKEPVMTRDSLAIVTRDHATHVIAEDYSYKTEAYYTILERELAGEDIHPSSRNVLDAFVVPICLERAKLAGIPVMEWGISQAYVPLPAILYGLNYFATASDFFVVQDNEQAKDVVKHITNKGKYPFCYQKLDDDATIHSCTAVFGRTTGSCSAIAEYAEKIYDLFSIPLVSMVFVKTGSGVVLSSLAPTRYTHLSEEERALLAAYRDEQEFL
ncbi:MAG: RimK-like ATPgrasp N-terminal domain-containing protein [Methanoregula sp.]|jgi:hypothetical protein|uniref:RimK-like ATPgrasp N-terminal domain-containing protein n=1 Tax=Methanoregula sp. TaxID=2052170 RepID=UPI003D0E7608